MNTRRQLASLAATLSWAVALPCTFSALTVARDAHAQSADNLTINVTVGGTQTMPTEGWDGFDSGSQFATVDTSRDGKFFLIKGVSPGRQTLTLTKGKKKMAYEIVVTVRDLTGLRKELEQKLSSTPGIRIVEAGNKLVIDGSVPNKDAAERIKALIADYKGQVEFAVVVGGPAVSDSRVLVRLDFFFVQYTKTSNLGWGIGWPSSLLGGKMKLDYELLSNTLTGAQATVTDQALPRLDIGARNGWAKVLKQTSLVTENGSTSAFSNGGETNFLTSVGLAVSVTGVSFGTKLEVRPRYESLTREVQVSVKAEIADLVPPQAGTVPGRTTTTLDTIVSLKLGQALVLSGVKTMTKRVDNTGIPFLSQIPGLGLLFGTETRSEEELEGAIFIIPSILDQPSKSATEMIRASIDTYKDYSGGIHKVESFNPVPPSAR